MLRSQKNVLVAITLALFCVLTSTTLFADHNGTHIEALNGGVVDLGGLTKVIGLGQGVTIKSDGTNSVVNMPDVTDIIDDAQLPGSTVSVTNGGTVNLNSVQTNIGNNVSIDLTTDSTINVGAMELQPGSLLMGDGGITANIINNGTIDPGANANEAGQINIGGDYTQGTTGVLNIDFGGIEPSINLDLLSITGTATIDGDLNINQINNYVPTAGSSAEIINASNITGQFANENGLTLGAGGTLSVNYGATGIALDAIGSGFQDSEGPVIASVNWAGASLVDGSTLSQSNSVTVTANDPSAVGRVEFLLDGQLVHTDYSGSNPFVGTLDLYTINDGPHILTINVFDTLDNKTTVTFNLIVALAVPAAPVINIPISGTTTNQTSITISGTADPGSNVVLSVGGQAQASSIPVSSNNNYSGLVTLVSGDNSISAVAQNRSGTSGVSNVVVVTVDNTIPPPPAGMSATPTEGGVIRLTWTPTNSKPINGFNLYRSTAAFSVSSQATKLNTSILTNANYDDLVTVNGDYYYRVEAVNNADVSSDLSNQAMATADVDAPSAVSITYTHAGAFDLQTGRMGVGTVQVELVVSEPLLSAPYLSIVPDSDTPISILLSKTAETNYTGSFVIDPGTNSGTAYAVFSARDLAGNRGTNIESGATVLIDTKGPSVTQISVTPADPIQNDVNAPVTVAIEITLDEPVAQSQTPTLTYQFTDILSVPTEVSLVAVSSLVWQGSIALAGEVGQSSVEIMTLAYQGVDDLNNFGNTIQGQQFYQIYQGDLPPSQRPTALTATALPNGGVKLNWLAAENAVEYILYRQAPGETGLTLYQATITTTEYLESGLTDGLYRYAVAGIRRANGQESESVQSGIVEVQVDSIPPSTPADLALELLSVGVQANWTSASNTETLRYKLYRSGASVITDVTGLTPVSTVNNTTTAIDPSPAPLEHTYAVTAVDNTGNESLPSNSVYLNFNLLPVTSFTVEQMDQDAPFLSWSHPATDIAGYKLFLGPDTELFALNQGLLTDTIFTDAGYADNERRYTIIAVDNSSEESLGRSVLLPKLRAELQANTNVARGVFNQLYYNVTNESAVNLENVILTIDLGGQSHESAPFTVGASSSQQVPVVVGGYQSLSGYAPMRTSLEMTPNQNENIKIIRNTDIEIADGMLVMQIQTQNLTRGGTGQVKFSVENTSDVQIEIVTANNNGNEPSPDLRVSLKDADDNVLHDQVIQQALGTNLITLSTGQTVSRIEPGARFESDWMDFEIPSAAPDSAIVQLDVEQLHYHLGQNDHVSIAGPSTSQSVSLVDTPYIGELANITPIASFGDQEIVITGRALDRTTATPMPLVPLQLILSVSGFERSVDVFTDGNGNFSYGFTPVESESGLYTVSIIHPDLTERPDQGQFTISKVLLDPNPMEISLPRNFGYISQFNLNAGPATELTDLRLEVWAQDQAQGVIPQGLQVFFGPAIALGPDQTSQISITLSGDESADVNGVLFGRLLSTESGTTPLAMVRINYRFSEAAPSLFFSPNILETGVGYAQGVTETVSLRNDGLEDLTEATISLLDTSGNPAPAWINLTTASNLGTLAIGEQREIGILVAPTTAVVQGSYEFLLQVMGANMAAITMPVFVIVTDSGIGNALFKASDIYTATLDGNGELIQGLAGATIKIQHEELLLIQQTLVTDNVGEALFSDLTVGRYRYRASATGHEDLSGFFWVKPGITGINDIFLNSNLVSVEWSVTEITLEDHYEVTLDILYETDVPAAVVVIEPGSVNLPEMTVGDVFHGEFTVTNYGLVRADDVALSIDNTDPYYRFELLVEIPNALQAKQRVTIPYRITNIRDTSTASDGNAGAGGSGYGCTSGNVILTYKYDCANGTTSSGGSGFSWNGSGSPLYPSCDLGGVIGRPGGGSGYFIPPTGEGGCTPQCPTSSGNGPAGGGSGTGL